MAVIKHADLVTYATALLTAGGFGAAVAAEMADLLVWANLRGVDSHGVLRIPRYVEILRDGDVTAGAEIEQTVSFGAVKLLDASRAPGASAMNRAVREACGLAEGFGLGLCGVRRTSHAGAIGYFVEQVARQGKIGVAMTASKPLMSYFGARGEALSTNPLAIGVPAGNAPPLVLDISTAAVALGKIMAAKDDGRAIPVGWGVDATGADTTDPHQVAAVLPMAGAKGSGLSLMIEILCSVLLGNPNIAPALSGGEVGGFNGLVIAIDPAAFGEPSVFIGQVRHLADAIHGLEPAPGVAEVLLPGERGHRTEIERRRDGIPVADGTLKRLQTLATELGVTAPTALA